jgi:hypothetical protein
MGEMGLSMEMVSQLMFWLQRAVVFESAVDRFGKLQISTMCA